MKKRKVQNSDFLFSCGWLKFMRKNHLKKIFSKNLDNFCNNIIITSELFQIPFKFSSNFQFLRVPIVSFFPRVICHPPKCYQLLFSLFLVLKSFLKILKGTEVRSCLRRNNRIQSIIEDTTFSTDSNTTWSTITAITITRSKIRCTSRIWRSTNPNITIFSPTRRPRISN